jgi:hypothetical protein
MKSLRWMSIAATLLAPTVNAESIDSILSHYADSARTETPHLAALMQTGAKISTSKNSQQARKTRLRAHLVTPITQPKRERHVPGNPLTQWLSQ